MWRTMDITNDKAAIDWFSFFFARPLEQHKEPVATALHCSDKQFVLYVALGRGDPDNVDESAKDDLLSTLRTMALEAPKSAVGRSQLLSCLLRDSLPNVALALHKLSALKQKDNLYEVFECALESWEKEYAETPKDGKRKHDGARLRAAFRDILDTIDSVIGEINTFQPAGAATTVETIQEPLENLWKSMDDVFCSSFMREQWEIEGRHFGRFDYKRLYWRLWRAHSYFLGASSLVTLFLKAFKRCPSAEIQIYWVPAQPTKNIKLLNTPVEFLSSFIKKYELLTIEAFFSKLQLTPVASSWSAGTEVVLRSFPEINLAAYLMQHDIQVFHNIIGMNTSVGWVSEQYLKATVPHSTGGSWQFSSTCNKISPDWAAPPQCEPMIGVVEQALEQGLDAEVQRIYKRDLVMADK